MFKHFKRWLAEVSGETYNYGCVMLKGTMQDFNKIQSEIDPDDATTYEDQIHITILYGILPKVSPDDIVERIKTFKFPGQSLWSNKVDIFENPGQDDVVKLTIESTKELFDFRNHLLGNIENEQTYAEFNPHITLAYVTEGTGHKYVRELESPAEFVMTEILYIPPTNIIDQDLSYRIPIIYS